MVPFILLVASFSVLRLFVTSLVALRWALAAMFLLTASAHWGKRRPDLVRMVPPGFRRPGLLVTLTGLLELAGVVGLLVPALAPLAGAGLTLLLVAMFPANVHAARAKLTLGGLPVPALVPRTLIQLAFVAATATVALASLAGG
jgi:uncharacterized membrane protein